MCRGRRRGRGSGRFRRRERRTVNLDLLKFDRGELVDAQTAMADYMSGLGNRHVETFEGFRPWGTGSGTQNLRHTAVGSFTPTGKTGSGDSVIGDGGKLQVRDDSRMRWGRYNTANTPPLPPGVADGNWLDSNDNRGMKWTIKGVGSFDTLAFYVIDAADVGGKFTIKVGDTVYRNLANGARLANGNIHLVQIVLSEAVDRLTLRLKHTNDINDGFGVDGAVVGNIAPIPLPPGLLLMLPALGMLAAARRRPRQA